MFLALDVGNTQTTYGLIPEKDGEVEKLWRTQTSINETADELAVRLHELFACSAYRLEDVSAVGVSCVVPSLLHAWQTALSRLNLKGHLIQATDYLDAHLIAPDIAAPHTIGADRLANAAEAKRKYGCPVIVVDFGTATNIDVIDERGFFVGGSISPGLMLSANALFKKAGMLTDVPIKMPPHAIGTTSEENLQAGLVLGWAGMVDGLVQRIKEELRVGTSEGKGEAISAGISESKDKGRGRNPEQCAVIGTGGLMSLMSEATHCFTHFDANLTLRGIHLLYQIKHQPAAQREIND